MFIETWTSQNQNSICVHVCKMCKEKYTTYPTALWFLKSDLFNSSLQTLHCSRTSIWCTGESVQYQILNFKLERETIPHDSTTVYQCCSGLSWIRKLFLSHRFYCWPLTLRATEALERSFMQKHCFLFGDRKRKRQPQKYRFGFFRDNPFLLLLMWPFGNHACLLHI